MKVFLKYILRSMIEKKGRFFLLLIAISLSTALVVASNGLVDIILNSIVGPQLATFENKKIVINSTDEKSKFFTDEGINYEGIDENSVIKELSFGGLISENINTDDERMLYVNIHSRDISYINDELITQGNLDNFTGATVIISERVSQDRNLEIGDDLQIVIGGLKKTLTVTAICGNGEIFYNDTDNAFSVIIPYDYISKDFNVEGKYNVILANSSEKDVKTGVEKFNENNTLYSAEEIFDEELFKEQFATFTPILYTMLVIVVVMSAIIIYSSFKLIITERLTTIGTFLSQGATAFKVKSILYLESIAYGLFGALFGNLLGVLAINIINRVISPLKDYGIYGDVIIKPSYLVYGSIFAIILSMISSYVPVRKISRLQVKDVILNDVRITKPIGWKKFIIGSIMICISVTMYVFLEDGLGAFAGLLILFSMTGVIFSYPKLIDILSNILYKLLRGRSRNIIYAINNLRTSKVLLGNITLIIVSLSSIIAVSSVGASMIQVVTEAYTELHFDIEISSISTVRENTENSTADYLIEQLKELGVKDEDVNLLSYRYGEIKNPTTDMGIGLSVTGMDIDSYIKYNRYLALDKEEYSEYIDSFRNDENGILITTALQKKTSLKVGDIVEVSVDGLTKEFNVSGIIDGKLYNNGYFVLVKRSTMREDFRIISPNSIIFNIDQDIDAFMKSLRPITRDVGASIISRDEMMKYNLEQNKVVVKSLNVFSYLAIIIAALGITNNVSIGFLQRKGEFAILSSVGMENSGRSKILIFESIAAVTWAMIITSIYCLLGLGLSSIMIKAIGMDMKITLDYKSLPMIYVVSLGIVLLATLPVYFKSKKLSIVQEIKYE